MCGRDCAFGISITAADATRWTQPLEAETCEMTESEAQPCAAPPEGAVSDIAIAVHLGGRRPAVRLRTDFAVLPDTEGRIGSERGRSGSCPGRSKGRR